MRIPSDSRKAREMLQQTHEAVVQDQQRGPPFIIRFNQYFNISGIADSEYQHYLQQALNGTEHPKMKISAAEDFAEESEIKATALGRDLTRDEAEERFLARDQFLTNKASRKEIDEGHLPKDTRAKVYRPGGTAAPRRTRTAAHIGTAQMEQSELDDIKADVKKSGVKAAERAAKQAVAAALGLEFVDEPPAGEPQEAAGWQRATEIGLTGHDVPTGNTTLGAGAVPPGTYCQTPQCHLIKRLRPRGLPD